MPERGKARTSIVSTGSNSTIKSSAGSLYRINWTKPTGGTIRIENDDLGAAPNLNTTSSATLFFGLAATTDYDIPFGPGIGFDKLVVAATSNARITAVYE